MAYPTLSIDTSAKPSALVLPDIPKFSQYNPDLKMADYVTQSHTLLQPQLDANIQDINENNKQTIQNANNDTLKRGIARGSYAGARVDTINVNNDRTLQRERLNNDIQANTMATDQYNTDWDRGYKLNTDLNSNNWNTYNAGVNAATTKYNNAYQLFRDDVGDQQWNYGQEAGQYQWQSSFDQNASQFNQTLSQNKLESDRSYSLQKAAAATAAANAKNSGSSASSTAAAKANANAAMSSVANAVYSPGQTTVNGKVVTAEQNAIKILDNNNQYFLNQMASSGVAADDALKYLTQIRADLNSKIKTSQDNGWS